MIRKEIYAYLLAYNLLRSVMYEASLHSGLNSLRFSLQATRQHLNNFSPKWINKTKEKRQRLYKILLKKVAESYQKKRNGSKKKGMAGLNLESENVARKLIR